MVGLNVHGLLKRKFVNTRNDGTVDVAVGRNPKGKLFMSVTVD